MKLKKKDLFHFKNINNDSEEEQTGGNLEQDEEEDEDGNDTSPSSTESGRKIERIYSINS
jgi:hypothetical protein